jgi:hypothetical protein
LFVSTIDPGPAHSDAERYLGSQQFEDDVLLALHEAVARRITAEPERVLEDARVRLARWTARDEFTGAERAYFGRWSTLLDRDASNIVAAIVERSDEGRFRRQCSPFAGALDDDERAAIRKRCEEDVRHSLGAVRR